MSLLQTKGTHPMLEITETKKVQSVWPQARINNAAVTCASVDRRGFDYAVVRVAIGATDVGFTTFKLQESDDNSTFTDIAGADYSVSPLVLPSSASSDTIWEWQVDLRGSRKRYLRPRSPSAMARSARSCRPRWSSRGRSSRRTTRRRKGSRAWLSSSGAGE